MANGESVPRRGCLRRQRIVAQLAFAFAGRALDVAGAAAGLADLIRAGTPRRPGVAGAQGAANRPRTFAQEALVLDENRFGRPAAETAGQGCAQKPKETAARHE